MTPGTERLFQQLRIVVEGAKPAVAPVAEDASDLSGPTGHGSLGWQHLSYKLRIIRLTATRTALD